MMRAARFAAQLRLRPGARRGAGDDGDGGPDRHRVGRAGARRAEQAAAGRPARGPGLDLLVGTGLAERVLPELPALRLERDEHHRHKDVYEHSLTVLEQAIELEARLPERPDLVNRLAALLHDIGKPATRRFEAGGKVSFHHHDVVGAKLVRKRLTALRFSERRGQGGLRPGHPAPALPRLRRRREDGGWTDSAVRRYVRDAGDQLERLHILTRADCTTRNQAQAPPGCGAAYDDLEAPDRRARRAGGAARRMRPDLDGHQIMEILDVRPARVVGQAYAPPARAPHRRGPARSRPRRASCCGPGGPRGAAG